MKSSGGRGQNQADAALRKLLESGFEGPVALVFGGRPNPDGTKEYRSVPIKAELGRELIDLVGVWQSKTKKRRSQSSLREYDSAPQPEDDRPIQFVDTADNPHLQTALGALKAPSDLTVWTRNDKKVGRPKSFVIELSLKGDGQARFFSRITSGKQLRGPGKVVAFLEGRRFQALEEQKVILLEDSFDCVVLDGYVFVLSPGGFESLFSYETNLATNATQTIDGIQQFIDPEKLHTLREVVGGNRALLRRIAGRILIDLTTANPEDIRLAIQKCRFNVKLDTTGGKLKLGFDGEDPKDLIRLLTDRAVEAIISKRTYIATALEAVEK